MARMVTEDVGEYYQHYPRVAAIITVRAGGKANAMACAWHTPISRVPPYYGIALSPKRFTCGLILEAGEFGVNFVPFDRSELIAQVGGTKGAEIDKFQTFSIATEKPLKTSVPILGDAYAAYECRLHEHKPYGDHEWIVGEIVAVHLREGAFTATGMLDLELAKPALYLARDMYVTASQDSLRHLERAG